MMDASERTIGHSPGAKKSKEGLQNAQLRFSNFDTEYEQSFRSS